MEINFCPHFLKVGSSTESCLSPIHRTKDLGQCKGRQNQEVLMRNKHIAFECKTNVHFLGLL